MAVDLAENQFDIRSAVVHGAGRYYLALFLSHILTERRNVDDGRAVSADSAFVQGYSRFSPIS